MIVKVGKEASGLRREKDEPEECGPIKHVEFRLHCHQLPWVVGIRGSSTLLKAMSLLDIPFSFLWFKGNTYRVKSDKALHTKNQFSLKMPSRYIHFVEQAFMNRDVLNHRQLLCDMSLRKAYGYP